MKVQFYCQMFKSRITKTMAQVPRVGDKVDLFYRPASEVLSVVWVFDQDFEVLVELG
jgi:hypothetical protein